MGSEVTSLPFSSLLLSVAMRLELRRAKSPRFANHLPSMAGVEATLAELTRHIALLTEQNAQILRELRRMAEKVSSETSGEATERKRSEDEVEQQRKEEPRWREVPPAPSLPAECIYLSRCGERFHTSKECVRAFGAKDIRVLRGCQRCTRG